MSHRILTICLLSLVTVLSIHVLSRVLEGATADVTSQNIYSLSEGTHQILDRMSEEGVQPVEITLYFSETTGKTLPRFIKDFVTYERYLRHLLRSYERAAQGKIEVRVVDPVTDSDEAVEAAQDGLEGRAINQHGDQFFFGRVRFAASSAMLASRIRLSAAVLLTTWFWASAIANWSRFCSVPTVPCRVPSTVTAEATAATADSARAWLVRT